jgi:sortase B
VPWHCGSAVILPEGFVVGRTTRGQNKPIGAHAQPVAKKPGSLASRVLLVLGILCLAAALAIAGHLIWQYADAQNRAARVTDAGAMGGAMADNLVRADFGIDDLNVDWAKLHKLNPEIVAWIVVPGTNINYAVVQGTDNYTYLRKSYDGEYSISGSIFLDQRSDPDLQGRNTIIYGHDMHDGTMFSQLMQYKDKDYFNEHRYIYIATPGVNYALEALATAFVYETDPLRQFDFATDQEFSTYLGELFDAAVLLPTDPRKDGSIDSLYQVTQLVTCDADNNNYRVILMAKTIDSKEVPTGEST